MSICGGDWPLRIEFDGRAHAADVAGFNRGDGRRDGAECGGGRAGVPRVSELSLLPATCQENKARKAPSSDE